MTTQQTWGQGHNAQRVGGLGGRLMWAQQLIFTPGSPYQLNPAIPKIGTLWKLVYIYSAGYPDEDKPALLNANI